MPLPSKTSPLGPASSLCRDPTGGGLGAPGWPWGAPVRRRAHQLVWGWSWIDSRPTPGSPDCLPEEACECRGKRTSAAPCPLPLLPVTADARGHRVTRSQKVARPRFSLRILCVSLFCILLSGTCYEISKPTPHACSSLTPVELRAVVQACRGVISSPRQVSQREL